MSYTIRNIRPSVLHIPDAGVRLEPGQTAAVETLSPQMAELLESQTLVAVSSDPTPPQAPSTVDTPVASIAPVVPEKKPGKTGGTAAKPETRDDAE